MEMVDRMSDVNAQVQRLLEQQVEDGRQLGVQVCAYHQGERVVDAWAGTMGPDDPRPVRADSLFCSWSMTKGVAATAVHILADRGAIAYDAPVAAYWTAFAQHGKAGITVAQALSHQAGLHAVPTPFDVSHLTDWDAGIRRMEAATPAYPPGTKTGYHAFTWGWLVGGLVQGATGRHVKDFIHDEIARPLGVEEEMFVGIPDDVEDRLTTLAIWDIEDCVEQLRQQGLPLPSADFYAAMPSAMWQHFNAMHVRQACIPAGNGHFTARALAKMYAALAHDGTIDGVTLVSPDRIPHLSRLMTEDTDIVLGQRSRKSIGFFLGGAINDVLGPMGPRTTAFGHGGAGGSIAFADPEAQLAVAITLNKMEFGEKPGQSRAHEICNTIRTSLGVS
jgi:CubicO group peptidase (beta-lactamase class C family)